VKANLNLTSGSRWWFVFPPRQPALQQLRACGSPARERRTPSSPLARERSAIGWFKRVKERREAASISQNPNLNLCFFLFYTNFGLGDAT